jgi:transcriptional regulator with XRE-family HTH domain
MTSPLLPNHLRSNRKILALSQDELAFLLGTENGTTVCRYERFVRAPSLETALAYEAIFKKSVSELFPGLYQKAEQAVAARAKALVERTGRPKSNQRATRKREALADLATLTA